MSSTRELHSQAMDLADAANAAWREGHLRRAEQLFEEAFRYEREAALRLASKTNAEPTRSVLHRSAAALALNCNRIRDAEQLITAALAGNPPAEIAEELRNLLEQVHDKSLSSNPRSEIGKARDDKSFLRLVFAAALYGVLLLNVAVVVVYLVRGSVPLAIFAELINSILIVAYFLLRALKRIEVNIQLPEKKKSAD